MELQMSDGTPLPATPAQVIVMDKELAVRHSDKVFYLRVAISDNDVDIINLDGAVTPLDARSTAKTLGYNPTHWMVAQEGYLNRF